ncbi:MAG: DUF2993 domain-containing protein [Hapalosiphonaceae cyanobacterium JJU2]|nr:MAG: DUF2993 domain-containing protein [Hapalosiphonaceae cyanobacterium JJU2]
MSQERKIEENLLSQVAENTLSKQLDGAEKIDVDVQTDLLKIVQGQADTVSFAGEGLEIQEVRIQEIEVQTENISINPLLAIFGQIELEQPVNTTARIVLKEADINHALTSDFVRSKIKHFDLSVDGETVSLQPEKIQISLLGDNIIQLDGFVQLNQPANTTKVGFRAMFSPRTLDKPILMKSFNCTQGEGISLDIVVVLLNKIKELVNLPYLEVDNVWFRIINMEVQKGGLVFLIESRMKQIPTI